jgi:hypothetical protein
VDLYSKKEGVIKIPPAANYLDGDTVTFSCKPKYFLHGDAVRTCHNGTWSPGWWVWCRDRNLEYALKWMTALLSIFGIVLVFTIFFCILWSIRRRKEADAIEAGKVRKYRNRNHSGPPPTRTVSRTISTATRVKRDAPSFSTSNGAASTRISYTPNGHNPDLRPQHPTPPTDFPQNASPYGPDIFVPKRQIFQSSAI